MIKCTEDDGFSRTASVVQAGNSIQAVFLHHSSSVGVIDTWVWKRLDPQIWKLQRRKLHSLYARFDCSDGVKVEIAPDNTAAAQSDSSDDGIDIFLGNQPLAKACASIYASPVFRNWWYDWGTGQTLKKRIEEWYKDHKGKRKVLAAYCGWKGNETKSDRMRLSIGECRVKGRWCRAT